jgi:hypothetical protein
MNLETTRLRGRPRKRWQDEVRGWNNSGWRKVAGCNKREMDEAPENGK